MQSVTISDTRHLPVAASPIDSAGAPGTLAAGAVATWNTNDPTVAVVQVVATDPTGLTATVSAVAPGTCTITCNDTNPAGTFSQGFTCVVTGGNAVGFNFTFGPPF